MVSPPFTCFVVELVTELSVLPDCIVELCDDDEATFDDKVVEL